MNQQSGAQLECSFCRLPKERGVAGETSDIFACDECIALMVSIRRSELGDAWPAPE